jgi:hypothetical protein
LLGSGTEKLPINKAKIGATYLWVFKNPSHKNSRCRKSLCRNVSVPKIVSAKKSLCWKVPVPKSPRAEKSLCRKIPVPNNPHVVTLFSVIFFCMLHYTY